MNSRNLNIGLTRIKFKNNHVVYENFVKCTIKDYEFNLSYNPTLLSGSQVPLYVYSGSNGDNILYEISGSQYFGTLKDFATGSISGSEFSPYITTVGLYNDAGELLAIGKMSAPIPISSNTDQTFLIKYDTQWVEKPYFTPSITPTPSISVTPSVTPTISVTPSVTPTISGTPSMTPTVTPSASTPGTPSVTPTVTATPSKTPSVTPSVTVSVTPSKTPSPTPSPSASPAPLGECFYVVNDTSEDASVTYTDRFGVTSCSSIPAGQFTYLCVKYGTGSQIYPRSGIGCTGGTASLAIVGLATTCNDATSCF